MRPIQLARALAQPQHVSRGPEPAPLMRPLARSRQRLFIRQQQRFVRGVEIHPVQRRPGAIEHATGPHEGQRLADPVGQLLIALPLWALPYEIRRPGMQLVQVGKTAARQRPQQVQRGCAGRIGAQQPLRLRHPVRLGKRPAIDDVATIAGQRHPVPRLGIGRTRLGILPRNAPHLHHRLCRRIRQHHRHLQQRPESLARRIAIQHVETLGAVAPLQQESPPRRHLGQLRPQRLHLTRKDQRREGTQLPAHRVQAPLVRIGRHLPGRMRAPALGRPGGNASSGSRHGSRILGSSRHDRRQQSDTSQGSRYCRRAGRSWPRWHG